MPPDHTPEPQDCRLLSDVLKHIGDRWTILVVRLLGEGPMRFNAIRRTAQGISQRMLTLTLRGLERDGLIDRTARATQPQTVDYALTERGRSLMGPLAALAGWADGHRQEIRRSRDAFDALQASDGEAAAPDAAHGIHRIADRRR